MLKDRTAFEDTFPPPAEGMTIVSMPAMWGPQCAVIHRVTPELVYYATFAGRDPDPEQCTGLWSNTHEAYYQTLKRGATILPE